jgi:hypothetical protein
MAAWVALVALRDRLGVRRTVRALGLFVLPFVLVIGGWAVRNGLWTGYFEYSFITGANLLFYKGAAVIALRDGISLDEAQQALGYRNYREKHPEKKDWSSAKLAVHFREEAAAILRTHPALYLRVMGRGVQSTLLDPAGYHLFDLLGFPPEGGTPWELIVRFAQRYVHVLYALVGFCLVVLAATRSANLFDALTLGTLVYIVLVSAGPEAYGRFRVPLIPILALYAGGGAWWIVAGPARALRALRRARSEVAIFQNQAFPPSDDRTSAGRRS